MTLHVLVVDDSAVVRQMVSSMLGAQGMEVATASDPLIAMQKMAVRGPDVILLDIEMPRMDGLTFLRKVMHETPVPVVICSALAGPSSDVAFRALECGAVDVVAKPEIGLRDFLQESSVILGDVIRGAAHARLQPRPAFDVTPRRAAAVSSARHAADDCRIIALGASTGGTEALRHILTRFPRNAPGTVIVQHMPEVFTAHFAKRLDRDAAITVREAVHGDRIESGLALIAPGNQHMTVERDARGFYVTLAGGALVSRHRPSVDVLFRSVAAAGEHARAALLTGMGTDGAEGLLAMRWAGAMTVAQDEATSVVFGMPREAIVRGAAEQVLPLDEIADALTQHGS